MTRVEKIIAWLDHDVRSICLLAAVVLAFFLAALIVPDALIWPHSGLGSDISYRHWPDLIRYAESWRVGRIALWDSSVALGRPLAGDATVLFLYPFTLAFIVLPPAFAFNLLDALHVFIAALFMFLLLRVGYKTSRPAALLSAFAFSFAPKFISHLAGGHVGLVWGLAWLPVVLLGLQLAVDGWLLGAALSALALAMQIPTHLQMPYYTAALASALWMWQVISDFRSLIDFGSLKLRWLMIVYAVWLISFVLLAAFVLLPLLELLPYNSRAAFSLNDANLYALPPMLLITLLVPSNFQFPEWTMFVGLVPLVFSGVVCAAGKQRLVWFWAAFAIFALIFSLGTGTPLFEMALAWIPGFKMLRVPTRLWFFGGAALAVLAGLGAERIADEGLRERALQWRHGLMLIASACLIGGALALIGYWILFQQWHAPTMMRLFIIVLLIGVGILWIRGLINARFLQWLLIPILLIDLLPLDSAHIDLVNPRSTFMRSNATLDFFAAQEGLFRVYSPAADLLYAVAAARGVETLEGLLAFQVSHAVQAIREATGCGTTRYATAVPPCLEDRVPNAIPNAEKLGRLNVRYISTKFPLNDPDFKLVFQNDHLVYENLRWQPRARVMNGTAEIVKRGAGRYEIKVSVPAPTQLIVSETWLPGWRVTVDDQPRNADRVEGALIGVGIEAGDHTIRLEYEPLSWKVGVTISLISLTALILWVIITWQRKTAYRKRALRHAVSVP